MNTSITNINRAGVGIGGLDLSGTNAIRQVASRGGIIPNGQHDPPLVFVLSWIYAVTTGSRGAMRWRQSFMRNKTGEVIKDNRGQRMMQPGFARVYGRQYRQLPVVLDSCFVQAHIQKTMPLRHRSLNNTIRAAEIIQPDLLFNHDEPDPIVSRQNFTILRDRFGDQVIPIVQVPAYWHNNLSIQTNARQIVTSAEWRFYEYLIGPTGIIALGGLLTMPALVRDLRGELAWWICYYTGFERFLWLLGQASYSVFNALGRRIIPAGPFKGDRLLSLCHTDGTSWLLDATLARFCVVHDHPDGQLLHRIQLRDNTKHFFNRFDCMAANLRAQLAGYRGDIKFPVSNANLPDETDPAAITQLKMDLFDPATTPKTLVKSGDWLVQP